jgi:hypothetical protein
MFESAFRRTNVLNIDTGGKVVEIEKTGVEQIKESQNVRRVIHQPVAPCDLPERCHRSGCMGFLLIVFV